MNDNREEYVVLSTTKQHTRRLRRRTSYLPRLKVLLQSDSVGIFMPVLRTYNCSVEPAT